MAPIPRQSAAWRLAEDLVHSFLMCLIPWWQGKMQGISPIQPSFAKVRLENIREFSSLQLNSLRGRAGN